MPDLGDWYTEKATGDNWEIVDFLWNPDTVNIYMWLIMDEAMDRLRRVPAIEFHRAYQPYESASTDP